MLINRVWNFVAILLERAEVSELFGEASEKTGTVGALGLGGRVDGAEVARQGPLGAGGDQDGWEQTFHTNCVKWLKG